ncbi:PREDICTED: uncharacterized protein LOC100640007 [Amphimedon queenslandica]|uniref:RanBP2-type domain-containing protein n=1 Tax=Amphimedon queenslandica TaxID=400682 RepID=A0A1X7TSF7_AMPQE|nr:PREDICTED: uncharacterized protein LOC100640007 [Amphimedon queenslandica]|eukprot:XP_003389932.1 PREDICTED: uncharacterized protein LOC100640007 [Amphimedon queenslandica]
MDDPAFYDKLAHLRQRAGDGVPDNILTYFLKKSKGDINHCITLLRENYWTAGSSIHSPESIPPERSVHNSQNIFMSRPHPQLSSTPNIHESQAPPPNQPHYEHRYNNSVQVPDTMPVSVPYTPKEAGVVMGGASYQVGVSHTSHHVRQSTAAEENILKLQREQLQNIKAEHDVLLKRYAKSQSEVREKLQSLEQMKRYSSQSSVSDDDLYMAECIQSSLRYDIQQERQRKQPSLRKSTSNWSCPSCQWSNNPLVTTCDKCSYILP